MNRENVNRVVLLLLLIFISVIFLSMIRRFLVAILMAGIFSALVYPVYQKLKNGFGGHKSLASLITLLLLVLVFMIPFGGLVVIVTDQAIEVGQSAQEWIRAQREPGAFTEFLRTLPFYESLEPYREDILQKLGELAGVISAFLIDSFSAITVMTFNFVFLGFIFLYSMYFFLIDGNRLLDKILYYLPLKDSEERRLLNRFTSVTRATLKGTVVIGVLQGSLAGLAFAVVGINGAAFWGAIMTVLSIIPSIGSGLVWVPAGIILAMGGHYAKAIGLMLFCGLVVGSLDNLLRPRLVGKDTEMHELFIFFSTFGGLAMFGILGFIIGPIIAALFITIWEIYGEVFKDYLPKVQRGQK